MKHFWPIFLIYGMFGLVAMLCGYCSFQEYHSHKNIYLQQGKIEFRNVTGIEYHRDSVSFKKDGKYHRVYGDIIVEPAE